MTHTAFSFQNIHLAFDDNHVIRGFDLDIPAGESFVLLGRSGSGKSVLLKILLNLISAYTGTILIEGKALKWQTQKHKQALMRRIGVVFQGSALFDSLMVWENVAFQMINPPENTPRHKAYEAALSVLLQVGLEEKVAKLYPSDLSGGMKRRVALARAIILSPSLLLLDEPTAGLDPVFSRIIGRVIQKLRKKLKATTLTITHDLSLARAIGDQLGVLSNGKLAFKGSFDDIQTTRIKAAQELIQDITL